MHLHSVSAGLPFRFPFRMLACFCVIKVHAELSNAVGYSGDFDLLSPPPAAPPQQLPAEGERKHNKHTQNNTFKQDNGTSKTSTANNDRGRRGAGPETKNPGSSSTRPGLGARAVVTTPGAKAKAAQPVPETPRSLLFSSSLENDDDDGPGSFRASTGKRTENSFSRKFPQSRPQTESAYAPLFSPANRTTKVHVHDNKAGAAPSSSSSASSFPTKQPLPTGSGVSSSGYRSTQNQPGVEAARSSSRTFVEGGGTNKASKVTEQKSTGAADSGKPTTAAASSRTTTHSTTTASTLGSGGRDASAGESKKTYYPKATTGHQQPQAKLSNIGRQRAEMEKRMAMAVVYDETNISSLDGHRRDEGFLDVLELVRTAFVRGNASPGQLQQIDLAYNDVYAHVKVQNKKLVNLGALEKLEHVSPAVMRLVIQHGGYVPHARDQTNKNLPAAGNRPGEVGPRGGVGGAAEKHGISSNAAVSGSTKSGSATSSQRHQPGAPPMTSSSTKSNRNYTTTMTGTPLLQSSNNNTGKAGPPPRSGGVSPKLRPGSSRQNTPLLAPAASSFRGRGPVHNVADVLAGIDVQKNRQAAAAATTSTTPGVRSKSGTVCR